MSAGSYLLALFIDLLQLLLQLLQSCLCHVLQEFRSRCPLVFAMRGSAHWGDQAVARQMLENLPNVTCQV